MKGTPMNTLSPDEQAIIDQFNRLEESKQTRVLQILATLTSTRPEFDIDAWKAGNAAIRAKMPPDLTLDEMLGYLDDVRGENDED